MAGFLPSLLNFEDLDDLQLQYFPSLLTDNYHIDDHQQDSFQENILTVTAPSLHNNKAESCKGRSQSSAVTFDHDELYPINTNNVDQNKKRKLLHRNVERQRRQDMSVLYESLRATLPTHCLKGKRSISDHMHEAVKYIQLMQRNIEELKKRRYKLNGLMSSPMSPRGNKLAGGECAGDSVTVNGGKELGMEVILNSAIQRGGGLPLSKILYVLIDQGLTIVCCTSSKANDRLIHTIQSEVSDGRSIDATELQRRLQDLVSGF